MNAKITDRRGGGERRSGTDRRRKPSRVGQRHAAPAAAGVAGTVLGWAAAQVSLKYGIPLEVTSPVLGLIFAVLAAVYNKVVLPWMR